MQLHHVVRGGESIEVTRADRCVVVFFVCEFGVKKAKATVFQNGR